MRQRRARYRGGRRLGFLRALKLAFRERQIYLRSEGEIQFITLGPWKQATALLLMLSGLFWLAYSSINYVFRDQLLAVTDDRNYRARLDYEDRLAEMRSALDRLNEKLLLDQAGYLDKVDEVRAEYEKLVERHRVLSGFMRRGVGPDKQGSFPELLDQPPQETDSSKGPIPTTSSKGSLNEIPFRQKYAAEFTTESEALEPLSELRARFEALDEMQIAFVDEVVAASRERTTAMQKVIARLGVRPKSPKPAAAAGVGGPFIAASTADLGSERLTERFEAALQNMAQEEQLTSQLRRLPLSSPMLGQTRITSRFGLRRDPFRRVAAMHTGVDLKGPYASVVVATAPGIVVKAGWEGAYGRSVEIAHDNGVSTVYAHMRTIKVKEGRRVARGEVVGLLGSTGRSTGPHLHYETRIGGRSVDPVRFWKARNDLRALSPKG